MKSGMFFSSLKQGTIITILVIERTDMVLLCSSVLYLDGNVQRFICSAGIYEWGIMTKGSSYKSPQAFSSSSCSDAGGIFWSVALSGKCGILDPDVVIPVILPKKIFHS